VVASIRCLAGAVAGAPVFWERDTLQSGCARRRRISVLSGVPKPVIGIRKSGIDFRKPATGKYPIPVP